jgi:Na+-transporting NADH:ubiquinone oxidoreductase subunit NqrF
MSVTLTINGNRTDVVDGLSLFDHAEQLGVRVPTSCRTNGKCKECIVEVTEGLDLLSPRAPSTSNISKERFRSLVPDAFAPAKVRSSATRCAADRCASNATRWACRFADT